RDADALAGDPESGAQGSRYEGRAGIPGAHDRRAAEARRAEEHSEPLGRLRAKRAAQDDNATAAGAMISAANRSISSSCGLHCNKSRSTPASANWPMRSATWSAVPASPARSPRFDTE